MVSVTSSFGGRKIIYRCFTIDLTISSFNFLIAQQLIETANSCLPASASGEHLTTGNFLIVRRNARPQFGEVRIRRMFTGRKQVSFRWALDESGKYGSCDLLI